MSTENPKNTEAALTDLDLLVLTVDLPSQGLRAGDVGTVVHVYRDGQAYEAEFTALDGTTVAVTTVEAAQVRPVTGRDLAHSRSVPVAA